MFAARQELLAPNIEPRTLQCLLKGTLPRVLSLFPSKQQFKKKKKKSRPPPLPCRRPLFFPSIGQRIEKKNEKREANTCSEAGKKRMRAPKQKRRAEKRLSALLSADLQRFLSVMCFLFFLFLHTANRRREDKKERTTRAAARRKKGKWGPQATGAACFLSHPPSDRRQNTSHLFFSLTNNDPIAHPMSSSPTVPGHRRCRHEGKGASTKLDADDEDSRLTFDALPDETLVAVARLVNCDDVPWCLARVSRRWRRVARDRSALGAPPCYPGDPPADPVFALYLHDPGCPQWHTACRDAVLDGAPRDVISALARNLASRTSRSHKWVMQAAAAAAMKDDVGAYKVIDYLGTCAPVLRVAARAGATNILKHLAALEDASRWDPGLPAAAASAGQTAALAFLHRSGCPWDKRTAEAAAAGGHLDCLAYAYAYGCPWDARTLSVIAARAGHSECARYISRRGQSGRDLPAPEIGADGLPVVARSLRSDITMVALLVLSIMATMACAVFFPRRSVQ